MRNSICWRRLKVETAVVSTIKDRKTAAQMEQRCFRLWNKQPWKACQHLGSQLRVKHLQHLRKLSLQVQTVCADLWPPTMFLKPELLCKPSQRRQEAWGGSGGDDGVETLKTQKQLVQTSCAPKTHKHVKTFLKLHSDSTLHSSVY